MLVGGVVTGGVGATTGATGVTAEGVAAVGAAVLRSKPLPQPIVDTVTAPSSIQMNTVTILDIGKTPVDGVIAVNRILVWPLSRTVVFSCYWPVIDR